MTDFVNELEELVDRLIENQLSSRDAARLNDLLSQSSEARRRYHELLDNHAALCAIYPGDVFQASLDAVDEASGRSSSFDGSHSHDQSRDLGKTPSLMTPKASRGWKTGFWMVAASLLIAVGLAGYFLGQERTRTDVASGQGPLVSQAQDAEQTIAGHATLSRTVEAKWPPDDNAYREGDVLPDGSLVLESGIAEIDFFCGATLIVEGPANLNIESDWSVRVDSGRIRANVPPAARGFLVKAAESEIIDLGTEFALEVASGNARVEVLDGEIELRGGEHDGNHLITGQRTWLKGSDEPAAFETLTTLDDVQQRRRDANVRRFNEWKEASRSQRQDPRLIAYYPIAEMTKEARTVRNAASSGEPFDGKVIGPVERKRGRFGVDSEGLDFERTGSRVRTRIEGEFEAFTFTCWARIDSLHHVYNALFMGDGYENGEPHWQIRDDGRLMFSVMVDDAQSVRVTDRFSKTFVQDAGLHRVYFSDPIWDISKSGQWLHLAAVYDPRGRQVRQFVNGAMVSEEQIIDKFFTPKLRIGPSEIGNWGQPFRDSPWFAVRNLNGTIDELAIYKEALDAEEIETMYQRGKPLGY